MMNAKEIIKQLNEPDVAEDEIIISLGHSYIVIIGNALMALGRKMRQDDRLRTDKWLPYLQPLTENDDVKNIELAGTYSSYFLMSCLWDIGTEKALQIAEQYLSTLSDGDRGDIDRFYDQWETLLVSNNL